MKAGKKIAAGLARRRAEYTPPSGKKGESLGGTKRPGSQNRKKGYGK